MRTLQISKFYPPIMGGIETVACELTEGLNRMGWRTDVLCSNQDRSTVTEHSPAGYDIIRAGSLGRLLATSISPSMLSLARRMAGDYDLLHVHMPDPMAALAVLWARSRTKVVVHWHSDVVRQRLSLHIYRHLQEWLLCRADAIVATSVPYARSSPWLARWQHKIVVIPIGISDIAKPTPSQVARISDRYGRRRIVFALGRMTYYKGFDVLIDAAAGMPDDCVIVVGGDGELLTRHRADALARRLSHKIVFAGAIGDDELAAHFAAAKVFCLPSTHRAEAYGIVLVEAMALGKPLITTDIPGSGVSWINQDGVTGFNVPVGDAKALLAAMLGILGHNAAASRMGAAARARYERDLSAEGMVQTTAALYRRLLSPVAAPNSTSALPEAERI